MNNARLFPSPRCAYSLAEVVIATALVGVVLVAALETVGGVARSRRVADGSLDGSLLARRLMEEVLAQRYADPEDGGADFGTESDEDASPSNREGFDDIDDYDGWSASPPQQRDGAARTGYSGWTRQAVVERLDADDPTSSRSDGSGETGVKRIIVAVTDPDGVVTTLTAIRSAAGALEQSAADEIVAEVAVRIRAAGADEIELATSLVNHAEGP